MVDPLPLHVERRLIDIHADAIGYYRAQLLGNRGSGPRAHLRNRDVSYVLGEDSIWRVGYAPAGWTSLTDHLRGRAYTDTELVDAGVSSVCRRGTLIDRFRDRIVVPIHDLAGAPVAFTARAAPGAAADTPKYLNTPTTPVYRKRENLLGLHEQRALLEGGGRPVIVEGAFDVLAVAGLNDRRWIPVSACGTHVTPEQLAVLASATTLDSGLVLAFDGDPPGRLASHRVAHYAAPWHDKATVLLLPPGRDPAELASRGGLDARATHDAPAGTLSRTAQSLACSAGAADAAEDAETSTVRRRERPGQEQRAISLHSLRR